MQIKALTIAAVLSTVAVAAPGWQDWQKTSTSAYVKPTTTSAYVKPATTSVVPVKPTPPAGGPTPPAGGPTPPAGGPTPPVCSPTPAGCLTDAQATQIISTYDTLINRNIHGAQFNATADALLASTYSLTSNSINADEGLPLNTVTIPNKEVFKGLFSNLPQGNGETTLDIFHSCNKISWRWTGTNPDGQLVRGISDFEITPAGQIGPVYSEYFNPTLDRCSNTTSKH